MPTAKFPRNALTRLSSILLIGAFIIVAAVLAVPVYSVRSASAPVGSPAGSSAKVSQLNLLSGGWKATIADPSDSSIIPTEFTLIEQEVPLATYAADCTTPKTLFTLGDVVCARSVGIDPAFNRRVAWIGPDGLTRRFDPILSDPQDTSYTLPTADTEVIEIFVVDNRGSWKVNVVSSRGSTIVSAPFKVQGATPRADLSIAKVVNGGVIDSGTDFTYTLAITNFGPNHAEGVEFRDPAPPDTSVVNATFVSVTQSSGPTFTCTGTAPLVCSLESPAVLNAGDTAIFELTYTASGAPGSVIANTAKVTSTTEELNDADNTASSGRIIIEGTGGTPQTCTLECPNDITVARNQAGGATVTFGAPDEFGDCGTTSYSHPSGSLFAVGTTTVTATSTSGSGSCSFTVTVIDAPNPTVSCPPDKTVAAPPGALEATVATGTATAGPAGEGLTLTVSATRDDEQAVTDPYPVGETTVIWSAKDQFDRVATCSQKITVTSPDAPTISCPSNKTFTTASCNYTATAAEIGEPTASGAGVEVTSRRSDNELLTAPFPAGTTTITWTATDDLGRVVSCIQNITVNSSGDATPPTLEVPPGITTTTSSCSVVLDDELGVATAEDSCGSVSISRTGIPTVSCPIPGNPGRQCETFVFPTGTTVITYTATDASGNSTSATQTITVTEDPAIPPTISAPAPVTLFTGPGATSCGVSVSDLDAALGTATASDNCPGVVVTRSGLPAGNVFPLGNTTVTYTATDKSGNTASSNQVVTVVDNTVPTIAAPADITLYTGAGATSCGVTVSDLDATIGTATTSDNCPGAITVARGNVPAGNVFPLGETLVSYTATDAHTNSSAPVTQKVTVVDNTPPTISCPANVTVYLPLNSTATSTTVTYSAATASDNCPGSVGIGYSQNSGTVFPVGPTTVTATATDANGNTASCSFTVTVLYNFTGFFNPVSNPPTLNSVNAGRSIPLKFSLSGNKGLDIFAVGYPASQQITCNSSAPLSELEGTETPGGSTLTYSPDTYHYNWKTEGSWAGTCRQLVVKLNDGSEHIALFKFK